MNPYDVAPRIPRTCSACALAFQGFPNSRYCLPCGIRRQRRGSAAHKAAQAALKQRVCKTCQAPIPSEHPRSLRCWPCRSKRDVKPRRSVMVRACSVCFTPFYVGRAWRQVTCSQRCSESHRAAQLRERYA